MEPLVEKLLEGFKIIEAMLLQKAEDGLSDVELDQLEGELGVFVSAVQYERELRQAAYEDARSTKADTNRRATKVKTPEEIYVENLEI